MKRESTFGEIEATFHMPRCFILVATIALLLLQSATAEKPPVPLEAKGFKGLLALSEDLNFYKKWNSPMPPEIKFIREVERGKKLLVILTFANAGSDEKGNGHVTFSFAMRQPNGTLVNRRDNLDALGKRSPAEIGLWMLSSQRIDIIFDETDPSGEYTFYATLTDHVKKVTLPLTYQLQLK